ncbi:MAG: transglycosylase SLT domain-containing protein [Saprospiraceae bacterium]
MLLINVAKRIFCLLCFLYVWSAPASAQTSINTNIPVLETPDSILFSAEASLTNDLILKRLNRVSGNCITPRVTQAVRTYIDNYIKYKTGRSKNMLGRRLTYFPIFEEMLRKYDLPTDLKYLAVVESALNPEALSRVGAKGLWQFMPATGKEFDLRQNSLVDERSDAVKSSEAAARYLKSLYKMYDDWALALAAYNSGPGRVNAAIKRAHSRNFWHIQRYLPKETRDYVPAFIGASYICNFFVIHEMEADIPPFDEQLTAYLKITEKVSFQDISKATGIPVETIKTLNAGYKKEYVPDSEDGHYVLLPQRVMHPFINYMNSLGSELKYNLDESIRFMGNEYGDGLYAHFNVVAREACHIDQLAGKYGCVGEQLCVWNQLTSPFVNAGDKLRIWRPIHVLKHDNNRIEAPASAAAPKTATAQIAASAAATAQNKTESAPEVHKPVWHTVQRTETLKDIARRYSVNETQIQSLNKFSTLKVGMRLKISN